MVKKVTFVSFRGGASLTDIVKSEVVLREYFMFAFLILVWLQNYGMSG